MKLFVFLSLLAVATAAPKAAEFVRPINQDCIDLSAGNDVALFPSDFMLVGDVTQNNFYTQVKNAQGFDVTYYNTYKVVENAIANETYVLYQCGTPKPQNASSIPAGAKFFEIPLTAVSAPETVPYAFMEYLGLSDRVEDVSQYVTSPCGQKVLACGNRTAPDFMALENATLLASTVGPNIDGLLTSSANPFPKAFAFSAAQDPGVLNRIEWIKFLGVFFNREKYASEVYNGIVENYNNAKAQALKNSEGAKVPVVAWITHYLYEKDENYQLSFADYKNELTQDAGAAILDFNTTAKIPGVLVDEFSPDTLEFAWGKAGAFKTKEEALAAFLKVLESVDVVIDETYAFDPASYNITTFVTEYSLNSASSTANLPWLSSKMIFREDGSISADGGLDWFESAVARPDEVLADMIRIVNTTRTTDNSVSGPFIWLRNLATELPTVITSADCKRVASCDGEPAPICPFVSVCPDGSTALLLNASSTTAGQCDYEACTTTAPDSSSAPKGDSPTNTAQMAAPAVIMLTILIVFVEALINFC